MPTGFSGAITGYGPTSIYTEIVGSVTNGSSVARSVRSDIRCPNGTVTTDFKFAVPAGETRGLAVLCDGVFTSGATVSFIEI